MAVITKIKITHDKETNAEVKALYKVSKKEQHLQQAAKLQKLLRRLMSGQTNGKLDLQVDDGDAVAASGTITLTGAGSANDTILINGVTFTAVASGATGNQWNVGASATASATAIKNAINASASALVNAHVVATSASGVVTITAVDKGHTGNAITIAKGVDAGSVMTASGARLAGGVDATAFEFKYGV